ncbi:uncharacterized protein LOC126997437 isoform X2 [Eriocheir sinensis]|uniref:uncharacterized protein LOC126997437 isoform X2 n=1 Tax=Eriocheir sinensis TaxID=95602 RepID=UPI0021C5AD56|nr:uncharacterized protein LOC126997437 isoform X2 [Eriocheir sinensis]
MRLVLLVTSLSAITHSGGIRGEVRRVGGEGEDSHPSSASSPALLTLHHHHHHLHPYTSPGEIVGTQDNASAAASGSSQETHIRTDTQNVRERGGRGRRRGEGGGGRGRRRGEEEGGRGRRREEEGGRGRRREEEGGRGRRREEGGVGRGRRKGKERGGGRGRRREGGGGGGRGRRREEGREGGGALSSVSQSTETSKMGQNSLFPRLKKRRGERRKTYNISARRRQHRGSRRAAEVRVLVDGGAATAPLSHFWRSTGLSPPLPHTSPQPFLLSPDELLNLALVGSLPHDAISQVRIHWLLDLVNATLTDGAPRYNFTQLDALMTHLHRHRLRPGFELMGNPGGIFSDLENATQVLWWRLLVEQTAARYVESFGLDWVSSWRWETWNEPDHHDFNNLNITEQGFLNYFEACRAGLLGVSPRLRLGGPGASCRDPSFSRRCWSLLAHCQRRASARCLDFLSVHKKGQEDADSILTQELLTAGLVRRSFPNLRHVPLVNDEGDFLKGWWRGLEWRADSRYAALVARAVAIHLPALSRLHYELLSFDNAFLNYRPSFFNQRTLVARFQMNSTSWPHVQLVKKPSYAVMGLLALLGDRQLRVRLHGLDDRLSVIASCRHCRPSQGSHANRRSAMDQSGGGDAETSHDLHVYSDDHNPPERRADGAERDVNEGKNKNEEEKASEEEEEGDMEERKNEEMSSEKEEERENEERASEEEKKNEDENPIEEEEMDIAKAIEKDEKKEPGTEPARSNIPSSLPGHKQHDPTLNLGAPRSRRSTRHVHTHAARKRGAIANAAAVGRSSVAAGRSVFSRTRPVFLPAQPPCRERLSSNSKGPTKGGAFGSEQERYPAVFPRPEGSHDGTGGKNGGGVNVKERGLDATERQGNEEESEEGNDKRVRDCENIRRQKREEKEEEESEDSEETEEDTEIGVEDEEKQNKRSPSGENERVEEVDEKRNEETEEENEREEENNEVMEEGNQIPSEAEETKKGEEKEEEESMDEPPGGAWEAAVLVSLSAGPARSPPAACRQVVVAVRVPGFLIGGVLVVAVYRLGGSWPGPYEAWQQLGRPEEPSRPQLAFMRAYENARRQGPREVSPVRGRLVASVKVCAPDVWVLHVCQPAAATPGQVVGVSVMGVTPWDALITWSDECINTRCVFRYEVEHSAGGRGGPYLRVNWRNATDNNFWYTLTPGQRTVQGWYRVRVVTYWGSTGAYSAPAYHPDPLLARPLPPPPPSPPPASSIPSPRGVEPGQGVKDVEDREERAGLG